jgi:SHAQKYF class myb-like DNA-binding protein
MTTIEVNRGLWTEDEHDRFLEAIRLHPNGPWRVVANHVGTRDARQVQTHAQKYFEKISRHLRGLRKERRAVTRSEHRLGDVLPSQDQAIPQMLPVLEVPDQADCLLNENIWIRGGVESIHPASSTELPSFEEALDILLQYLDSYPPEHSDYYAL